MANPDVVYKEIKETLERYINTQFALRHPALTEERLRLFNQNDYLSRDYFLEPVIPYDSNISIDQVVAGTDIDIEVLKIVSRSLFHWLGDEEPIKFRDHQADALRQSLQAGAVPRRNVVVTSGTGSGKTESFLLPVLYRLVKESENWTSQDNVQNYWCC